MSLSPEQEVGVEYILGVGRVELARGVLVTPDAIVNLTSRDRELLAVFASAPGQVVSREELAEAIWSADSDVDPRTVDQAVKRLRGKLELQPSSPEHFLTIHGEGYRFEPTVGIDTGERRDVVGSYRAQESDKLIRHLRQGGGGLCTLVGDGGVGKTTLAQWVYQRWPDSRRHFVEVTECRTRFDVLERISDSIAEVASGALQSEELMGVLERELQRGDVLLVLDNAETMTEEIARLATEWCERIPDLRILVTSRVPLNHPKEAQFSIGPLPNADADGLFRAQAALAGASASELEKGGEQIAVLLEKAQGIPLAIQLLAAHCGDLSLFDVAEEVEPGIPLDLAGPRDLPLRQRTMWATHQWSYDLLSDFQRRVWGICALVPEVVDEDLVRELVETREMGEVGRALHVLTERGLLRVAKGAGDAEPEWRLWDTSRAFLETTQADEDWHQRTKERLTELLIGFAKDESHFGGARRSASMGRRRRLISWLRSWLATHEDYEDESWACVLLAYDRLRAFQQAPAIRLHHLSRAESRQNLRPTTKAQILRARGECFGRTGRFREARRLFGEALNLLTEDDETGLRRWLYSNLGLLHWASGEPLDAVDWLMRARLDSLRRTASCDVSILLNLIMIHVEYGAADAAWSFLSEVDENPFPTGEPRRLLTLVRGRLARDAGEWEAAHQSFERTEALFELSEDSRVYNVHAERALLMADEGKYSEAVHKLSSAVEETLGQTDRRATVRCRLYLCLAHFAAGNFPAAFSEAEAALGVFGDAHRTVERPYLLAVLAVIHTYRGLHNEARDALTAARALLYPELGQRLQPFLRLARLAVEATPDSHLKWTSAENLGVESGETVSSELRLLHRGLEVLLNGAGSSSAPSGA